MLRLGAFSIECVNEEKNWECEIISQSIVRTLHQVSQHHEKQPTMMLTAVLLMLDENHHRQGIQRRPQQLQPLQLSQPTAR